MKCDYCNGTGRLSPRGYYAVRDRCSACDGTGERPDPLADPIPSVTDHALTPRQLPWKAVQVAGLWDVTNDAGDPREEYSVLEYATEAECRFIARAANCHAELVAVCKSAAHLLRRLGGTNHDREYSELLAAISKAEGGT